MSISDAAFRCTNQMKEDMTHRAGFAHRSFHLETRKYMDGIILHLMTIKGVDVAISKVDYVRPVHQ